jgi:hypothetical protein
MANGSDCDSRRNLGDEYIRGAIQKFPDLDNIVILGLKWLEISIVPFKIDHFRVRTASTESIRLLEASLELSTPNAVQQRLQFTFNFYYNLESSPL